MLLNLSFAIFADNLVKPCDFLFKTRFLSTDLKLVLIDFELQVFTLLHMDLRVAPLGL